MALQVAVAGLLYDVAGAAPVELMDLLQESRCADPLGLDRFFGRWPAVVERPAAELLQRLDAVVRTADEAELQSPAAALAALRDLDFLLCAVQRAEAGSYKGVDGLEALLVRLGQRSGHIPRGSNTTYGLCNPLDHRMRLFTGLPEERMFISEVEAGMRRLDQVLRGLASIAYHPIDSPAVVDGVCGLEAAWEPMVGATVAMLRRMPPEVFSGHIVTCFMSLDIAGTTYQGVTGAQSPSIGVDYLLWGVESTNREYQTYARTNLAEQLPIHRQLVADVLARTGGASLLTYVERQLSNGRDDLDGSAAEVVLAHLEGLLRRIGTFRAAHRRTAEINLPLRPDQVGSGGHTMALLGDLADATTDARRRVKAMRSLGPSTLGFPRRLPGSAANGNDRHSADTSSVAT